MLAKRSLRFLLGGLCLAVSGCFLDNAVRVAIVEPLRFPSDRQRHKLVKRNEELAEKAWYEQVAATQGTTHSPDYRDGFLAGYTDYLNLGGTGVPPPVPPREYWRTAYRNPCGEAAAQQWFAGFHGGSAQAMASGLRPLNTVPASACIASRPLVGVLSPTDSPRAEPSTIPPAPPVASPPAPAAKVLRDQGRQVPSQTQWQPVSSNRS